MEHKSFALIVGVSEYELPGAVNLPACVNDAEAMDKALQQNCYFDPDDIHVLKGKVSVEDFCAELELLYSLDADTVVLYFSGHGCLLENGQVSLVLSDELLPASSIVARCRNAHQTNWLIFDICHAGAVSFDIESFSELNARAGEGCALFAACSPDMVSYIDAGSRCSAFTNMLIDAMVIARCKDGEKSLADVERALSCLVKVRNQTASDRCQHPLLLHSSVGPIAFKDPAYTPYRFDCDPLPETEQYKVVQIKPCFADRKRYSCKVLIKAFTNRESLVRGLPELISELKGYEVYETELEQQKWMNQKTQVLFIYFAANEEDLINELFFCWAIWSDMGSREKLGRGVWYEEANCWVDELWTPSSLNEMRRLYREGVVSDAAAIQQAKDSLSEVATCASDLFLIGDCWLGGLVGVDDFTKAVEASEVRIEKSLEKALQIGYPSERLRPLENHIIDLAGALRDLPLFFLGKGRIGRTEENLKRCFRITRERYDEARRKIAEIVESELS